MAPLERRAPDGVRAWSEGPVAMGLGELSTTPAEDGARLGSVSDCVIALEGRIDNGKELRAALDVDETSIVELLGHGYRAWGEKLFSRLVGEFALLIWDAKRRLFFAARDALGTRPLYFWERPGELSVASDVEAFLALPGFELVPDDQQVLDFLIGNYRDATRTFLRGARRVPNGHYLTLSSGAARLARYWFPPGTESRFRDRFECYEEFREIFRRSVSRRLSAPGPVLAHLSGGLDSTAILCTADRLCGAGSGGYPLLRGVAALHPTLSCDESAYISLVAASVSTPVETWDGTESEPVDSDRPLPGSTRSACDHERRISGRHRDRPPNRRPGHLERNGRRPARDAYRRAANDVRAAGVDGCVALERWLSGRLASGTSAPARIRPLGLRARVDATTSWRPAQTDARVAGSRGARARLRARRGGRQLAVRVGDTEVSLGGAELGENGRVGRPHPASGRGPRPRGAVSIPR